MNEVDWEKVAGEAWTESEVKEAVEWQERFVPMMHRILEAHPDPTRAALVAKIEAEEPAMPAAEADQYLLLALADFARMMVEALHNSSTDGPRQQSLQAMGLLMKALLLAYTAGFDAARE